MTNFSGAWSRPDVVVGGLAEGGGGGLAEGWPPVMTSDQSDHQQMAPKGTIWEREKEKVWKRKKDLKEQWLAMVMTGDWWQISALVSENENDAEILTTAELG